VFPHTEEVSALLFSLEGGKLMLDRMNLEFWGRKKDEEEK